VRLSLVTDSDVESIGKVWESHHSHSFELPSRKRLIVEAKVVNGDRLIAYGQVRLVAEPIFVLDLDARPREKIEALKLLMSEAYRGIERFGLRRAHAFIRDPYFADLIVRHFGWERGDLGELLIKEL
jgi:hypothetical protein